MSTKMQNVQVGVWYVFLATIAWQTRLILWQADIQFIEWRAVSLYATDILMVILFVLAFKDHWRPLLKKQDIPLGLLLGVALFSLSVVDQGTVGVYQFVRLVQFVLLYLYVRDWAMHRFSIDTSATMFVIGALGQSVLALAQYMLQHDVGIRLLGETLLTPDMRGVAVFYDGAQVKILRAYGTLPHPNILAAYLMLATWALGWLYLRHGTSKERLHQLIWSVCGALLVVAMYVTYSRTMIVAWLGASTFMVGAVLWPRVSSRWPNISTVRHRMRHLIALIVFVSLFFTLIELPRIQARMTISSGDEAVRLRVMYNKDAIASGHDWALNVNWTGVGIGNFTSWLARYDPFLPAFMYQPAHNVFLLIYSELGILGLVTWLIWLGMLIYGVRHADSSQPLLRWSSLAIIGALLFISLFDHFFWTLQQGRIIFWLVLAMVGANQYNRLHV